MRKLYAAGWPRFGYSTAENKPIHNSYPLAIASIGEDVFSEHVTDHSFDDVFEHLSGRRKSSNTMLMQQAAGAFTAHDFAALASLGAGALGADFLHTDMDDAVQALLEYREVANQGRRADISAHLLMAQLSPVLEARDRQRLLEEMDALGIASESLLGPSDIEKILLGDVRFAGVRVTGQLFRVPLMEAHGFYMRRRKEGMLLLSSWTQMQEGEMHDESLLSLEDVVARDSEEILTELERGLRQAAEQGGLSAEDVSGSVDDVEAALSSFDQMYAGVFPPPAEGRAWDPFGDGSPLVIEHLGPDYAKQGHSPPARKRKLARR